jgi:hypothetical protein
MNLIALVEAPAATRRALLGALAKDPVVPARPARRQARVRPRKGPVTS